MENIQFTFKHNLNNNFLEIEGSKTFNNKNYVCSVYDNIDKIDLQEVLSKITISIQNGIIEDLTKDNIIYVTTNLTCDGFTSELLSGKISSKIKETCSEIHIKFEERK